MFQLWYFKEVSLYQPLKELKKMQRVVLWITEAFCTLPTWGVEAIASLIIPIHFHLDKIIG